MLYGKNRMNANVERMFSERLQWRSSARLSEETDYNFKNPIFGQLQQAVRSKSKLGEFSVGTEIFDQWTDVKTGKIYDVPWRVVSYQDVLNSSGNHRWAAILLRNYVVPARVEAQEYQSTWRRGLSNSESVAKYDYDTGCSSDIARVAQTIALPGREEYAKFFAPSAEELHIDARGMLDEDELIARQWREYLCGVAWEYFQDTPVDRKAPCPKRVFSEPSGVVQPYLLRSISRLQVGAYDSDELLVRGETDGSVVVALSGSAELRNGGACACLTACAVF